MSHRKVVSIVERSPADPGTPPNTYIAQVTVDMRVALPPDTPAQDIDAVIVAASSRLRREAWVAAVRDSWIGEEKDS